MCHHILINQGSFDFICKTSTWFIQTEAQQRRLQTNDAAKTQAMQGGCHDKATGVIWACVSGADVKHLGIRLVSMLKGEQPKRPMNVCSKITLALGHFIENKLLVIFYWEIHFILTEVHESDNLWLLLVLIKAFAKIHRLATKTTNWSQERSRVESEVEV